MTIGFIGLGNMGAHMARNLLNRGAKLAIFDTDRGRMSEFLEKGALICSSPAEIASKCTELVTMLPNSSHVMSVYTEQSGILNTLQAGSLCIDCSTIDQSVTTQIAELVSNKGANFIDAPVSGGVLGAKNGTLCFMVGGEQKVFEKAKSVLELMGKNAVHCGKVGSGQATKLCNNLFLASQMVALAETMNLGVKLGLDPKILTSVINSSTGRCWASDTYNPVPGIIPGTPACADYAPGFSCTLMAKDLGLAQNLSTQCKTSIPMGSLAHQIYLWLSKEQQFKDKDFTVIYKFFSENQKSVE